MPDFQHERTPLLQDGNDADQEHEEEQEQERRQLIEFHKEDSGNPKAWSRQAKLTNVGIISLMALLSPLASSMFTPGIAQIADDLKTDTTSVIATTTGFVVMLGVGPLILAPLSETFGRRSLYIWCYSIFSLLQIPTALSPNVALLITARTLAGFFGSVGIANGGGTISDMFEPSERAGVFGWYLLGPLLGPSLGPLFGGVIVQRLGWRWMYWLLLIICALNTLVGYFFLRETYRPVLLSWRKAEYERRDEATGVKYYYEDEDSRPILTKLAKSMRRPLVIFVQPIVLTMSLYQALVFGTTYSIYTNMQEIYSSRPYNLTTEQIGLLYLAPGLGFLTAVWFLVPRIDTVYNALTARHNGQPLPEYRLPLANIGAVLIPISLFTFAWTVEYREHVHWFLTLLPTYFYGVGMVMILNTAQNYYIDSFERYAASAIAAGAVFRSLLGGVVPLFAPALFEKLGYGWGVSVFAFLSVIVAPSPLLFQVYGKRLRERYQLKF